MTKFAMDVSTENTLLVDGQRFQPGEIETAGGITTMENEAGVRLQFRYNDLVIVCAGEPADDWTDAECRYSR